MKKKLQNFKMKNFKSFMKRNKNNIGLLAIGLVIGALITSFFIPERIAKLSDGKEPIITFSKFQITADDYYTDLKNLVSLQLLVEIMDRNILNEKYPTTEEIQKEVETNVNASIKEYTDYYEYTENDFLTNNGFKSKDEFYELLLLEYKRNLYVKDYALTLVKNDEINNYYIKSLNPDMEIKYITGEEAVLSLVLNDLKNGKTYDDIIKSYKNKITYKDYSYVAFDNENVNKDMYDAALVLKENSYTTSLKSINGTYYIIFKGDVKDKDKIDDIRDRIKVKVRDQKMENDTTNTIYYDALVKLRNDAGIKFNDTTIETMYKNYIKELYESAKQTS